MSEVVINVTKVEEVVTINATPNVTQILVNTNSGGGGAVSSVFGRSGNVVAQSGDYETAEITESTDKKYVTDAEKTKLSNLSGTNTGDETTQTIQTKRPLKTINNQSLEGSGNIVISGGGAVDSVNSQTGVVVLDADDISDSSTTNKFVTSAEKTAITHSNRSILDAITESFTTALKTAYDGAKSNIDALLLTGARLINASEITKLSNTSGTNSGDNATNTTSNSYADAKVENNLTASTTIAPSKTAVNTALNLKVDKSDFEDWTDFSGTSTIVGWTTPTISYLRYTRTGKVLTIRGRITGTSNSFSTSFTIPFTLANLGVSQSDLSGQFTNNSIASPTPSMFVGADNSNVVSVFRDGTALSWTNSGTKTISFLTTFIIQ